MRVIISCCVWTTIAIIHQLNLVRFWECRDGIKFCFCSLLFDSSLCQRLLRSWTLLGLLIDWSAARERHHSAKLLWWLCVYHYFSLESFHFPLNGAEVKFDKVNNLLKTSSTCILLINLVNRIFESRFLEFICCICQSLYPVYYRSEKSICCQEVFLFIS